VELGGADPDVQAARRALTQTQLQVTSICPLFGADADFASDSATVRQHATQRLREWLELAHDVGAEVVIVVPSDRATPEGHATREQLLDRCAEGIGAAVSDGDPDGPVVVIEALNRYETHLVRTLGEAEQLRQLIDSPRVELMADVFHMNIEEDSLVAPLVTHGAHLRHVHLADNQRRAPGSGQLPFRAVLATLASIGYQGALALECVPAEDAALAEAATTIRAIAAEIGDHVG
jgi:sugar phosphate isomerase/epimerase